MDVSIFGFGKVGTALGVALASKGHEIIGVDVNEKIINEINRGFPPFPEGKLDIFLKKYHEKIRATKDYEEPIKKTGLSFIIVPTPSTKEGPFDNKYIYETFEQSIPYLKEKGSLHTFVICSTVSPGSMKEFKKFFEEKGFKDGENFRLYYNPAFIRQGSIINDFLFPDIVLIGGSEKEGNEFLEDFWKEVVGPEVPFVSTNFINAELAKITLNTFVTLKISFSNLIGSLCEKHKGANADIVMSAIRESKQIVGKKLLSPALGYGGPCLPRDNTALRAFAKFPEEIDLSKVVDAVNHSVVDRIIKSIESIHKEGESIGVLGLTYKTDTYLTVESQALQIANNLSERFGEVRTYDPMAEERNCNTKEEVIENSDVILLLTPWKEFSEISEEQLKGKKIYDAWRVWENKLCKEENYHALGVNKS